MGNEIAVKMTDITKTFGEVYANRDVCLDIHKGEILSLLGENGSGKTTLMNILSGIYFPDHGSIEVNGEPVVIRSPKDAFDLHIGMIHQHFKLIDVFTAAENVLLGMKDKLKNVKAGIIDICTKYGFVMDPDKKIYDMSVSEKQTLEIIKVLYRGADILILDEPTAVLTPQETEKLFKILRAMRADGKSIVIITHKLHEVLSISDRVAVLRKGEYIGSVKTGETDAQSLSNMMVGRSVSLNIERLEVKNRVERLRVEGLSVHDHMGVLRVDNVSFTAYGGEILIDPNTGEEEQLCGKNPQQIREMGVGFAFVPEDRLGMGLVASMDIPDNMLIRSYLKGKSGFVDMKISEELASKVVEELGVHGDLPSAQ